MAHRQVVVMDLHAAKGRPVLPRIIVVRSNKHTTTGAIVLGYGGMQLKYLCRRHTPTTDLHLNSWAAGSGMALSPSWAWGMGHGAWGVGRCKVPARSLESPLFEGRTGITDAQPRANGMNLLVQRSKIRTWASVSRGRERERWLGHPLIEDQRLSYSVRRPTLGS